MWRDQEARDAAEQEEMKLYAEYISLQPAINIIHNFKRACEERNLDYADAFLSGDMTAEEYMKVREV